MALKLFISYARADRLLKDELLEQLSPLRGQNLVEVWHDRDISAGEEWDRVIRDELERADIIMLLVSPAFMASEYAQSVEIKRALEKHARSEACVVPVIMRPVLWSDAPFARLHVLPQDALPVTNWLNRDAAMLNVAAGVKALSEKILLKRKAASGGSDASSARPDFVSDIVPVLPKTGDVVRDDISRGVYCYIPAGRFTMGRDSAPPMWMQVLTADVDSGESPAHPVQISKDFWFGKYPVTQAQWERIMGANPSRYPGADRPVEGISWNDCQAFLARLNSTVTSRWTYRLPTEAEWEYAARAGTRDAAYDLQPHDTAWFDREDTQPVGKKSPNPWGLHDMLGNVWEWCSDWSDFGVTGGYYSNSPEKDPSGPATGTFRVLRGSAFYKKRAQARVTIRNYSLAGGTELGFGMRCVLVPKASS